MKNTVLTIICSAATLLGSAAIAADDNEKAIKARQGEMQLRSFNAGPLFGMAKGKMDYNAELAAELANNLATMLNLQGGRMWPQGSDNKAYPDATRALPEAWTTWPKIGEAGKKYGAAVTSLAATAGNGLGALQAGVSDLGKACKGCHDDFRAEEE